MNEMSTSSSSPPVGVELGFVEECPTWKLASQYFPSKIGGKPAWLKLKELPSTKDLLCQECGKPCAFLLQVYAPLDDSPSCFHRTVFVFACVEPACAQRSFKAFRCQLPRDNEEYGPEPVEEEEGKVGPQATDFHQLCVVCGCLGPFRCSKCHKIHYCSVNHQMMDWKAGHRRRCQTDEDGTGPTTSFLLKEYELVIELEPTEEKKAEKSDAEAMDEYQKFLQSEKEAQSMLPESDETIESEIGDLAQKEDKQYQCFMKRIKREPEQVLRYERCGQPLWVSGEHAPEPTDVPPCSCGSPRQFEFQILPQLLNHLSLDELSNSLDWGTLAVYTCSKDCADSPAYRPEFVWNQDFSNSNNHPFT